MRLHDQQRVIVRYFYLLLLTVGLAGLLLVGLSVLAVNADSRARDELEGYHLRSLTVISEMSARLSDSRGDLIGAGPLDGELAEPLQRQIAGMAYALTQNAESLTDLQNEVGEDGFSGAVERVRQHTQALEDIVGAPEMTSAQLEPRLEALELSLFQLSRLHSIDVESDLREIADADRRILTTVLIVAPLLLVLAFVFIRQLFRLLRQRLREHEEAERALLESQRRLELTQRLDALGTLVGGVAHDFNNLLMVILLRAEIAQEEVGEDHPAYEALSEIWRAGDLAAELTRQLLAFSRHESGTLQVTDLNALIRELDPMLRGLTREDIRLDIECAPMIAPVLVDQRQMQQVLLNLVINARDAMPTGGRLMIRTGNVELDAGDGVDTPGSYARVRVSDTGVGMSSEVQARAFEPFFTTKERGEGTGLGLSTVHGVVTASGGHVSIESAEGGGTTIDVFLPRVDHEVAASHESQTAPRRPESETILLVEDGDQIREVLAGELHRVGYDVIEASHADEALQAIAAKHAVVDLVLTDVVMPGMRGTALVKQLRRSDPDIGVVFMSGYVEDDVLTDVVDSGEAFIPKPFRLLDVLDLVRRELDRRALRLREPQHTTLP